MRIHMKGSQGFSMIEVLITLLLVTIGVLGMVALQGRTIGYTQDSIQRSTAATLANDLIEQIRANPTGLPASSGFYKAAGTGFPSLLSGGCSTTSVTASEQLACWSDRASKLLPGASDLLTADFYVCRTSAPGTCSTTVGSAIEIQVAWVVKAGECLDGTSNTKCTYRLRAEI